MKINKRIVVLFSMAALLFAGCASLPPAKTHLPKQTPQKTISVTSSNGKAMCQSDLSWGRMNQTGLLTASWAAFGPDSAVFMVVNHLDNKTSTYVLRHVDKEKPEVLFRRGGEMLSPYAAAQAVRAGRTACQQMNKYVKSYKIQIGDKKPYAGNRTIALDTGRPVPKVMLNLARQFLGR